ncbi:hypothetical protein FACUT_3883 [Fusarium acutatum]|uniref:CBM-cenC domain-containing protein n=1 Tax=Fusarium acutatum TaxID=78861 RepID=A0A8H4JZA6_9HYPO|nr:hypothetical protein FACUT_3883 [Fusarium acutatum]
MRVLALHLLAMCQLACASPCKPSSSSGSVLLSTTSAEVSSIPVVSSSTIADETETSTTFFTGSTAVSETETVTSETETDAASDLATSTILITTSSTEPTTLATSTVEATTTTTAAAEPTNVLTNSGFDSGSITPWDTIDGRGALSLSDEGTHAGEFSGYFYADNNDPERLGVYQPIDQSLIEADTEYHYSIWIKTVQAVNCNIRQITCGAADGFFLSSDWAGPYNEWTQFTMSCIWNQASLGLGPTVVIRAECQTLEFYVDDAVLVEAN